MNKSKETTYNSLVTDIRNIIEEGRRRAFASAGQIAILKKNNLAILEQHMEKCLSPTLPSN